MAKSDSKAPGFASKTQKPQKPHPQFPLFPHATKRWAKKIRGKLYYFGPWDAPDDALKSYEEQKDALHSGRKPREVSAGVTVKDVCNAYLNHQKAKLDRGDLSPRTWSNYHDTAELIVTRFGKSRIIADLRPDDFADLRKHMARNWGPVRVRNFIQQVRSVFKYALETELIATTMRFGPGFDRPTKKTIRLNRAKKGPQMFEPAELRALVNGSTVERNGKTIEVRPSAVLKAMILLGVNCGFGNADCGTLPRPALDLDGGFVNYHRPKTGITRRCPLWPETVAAIRATLAERPEPTDPADAELVFLTRFGGSWHKDSSDTPISNEMRKLLNALGIGGKRNFYALRHTFETIGGEAKDQVAVDHIMGHARDDMASQYRERISDERFRAVSDHVRKWVFEVKE
ncbi:site-specific integrase [Gemmata sp. JC717]|uniref:tyrosine-type recombinase/integrase n=1 Tax=Gemmata algarum TaxID=2975278 RepID=UPI0021BB8013|nr:site-specific integrase [Gemmata algarum]MDY3553258.1 site-specific integrase [Gemmata algarum]